MTGAPAFEFIEHTADIAVRAYGDTLEEALASAATALFALTTNSADLNGTAPIARHIEADDTESLVVRFLSELIVVFETEHVVLSKFVVVMPSATQLHMTAYAQPFDPQQHAEGIQVKGVSYHMLEIADRLPDGRAMVQVLFDI